MKVKVLTLMAVTGAAGIFAACGSTANNTVTNTNMRSNANVNMNANSNVAVLVNSNSPMANSNRWANSNVSRADYDKNRADYERDRGDSTIGSGANDSWLWFKTRAALLSADDLGESGINVDVENDVVTLRGEVETAAEKATAEKTAKAIDGVKSVRNQLKVVPDNDSGTASNANGNRR